MKILLVEDDLALAKSLTFALAGEGFTTNHVASGKAALLTVETEPPELVILDLGLPDMDGLAVLRQLQQGKKTASHTGAYGSKYDRGQSQRAELVNY